MEKNAFSLNVDQIQKFLPHRPPFLFLDRILEIHTTPDSVGSRVVALKNVSMNEPYFKGHFPGFAIMPGVLIIETMAQTASFSVYPSIADRLDEFARTFRCILVGVDSARFRHPVVPGDALRVQTVVERIRGKLWMFDCTAEVEGKRVAEAKIMANLETS